MEDRLGHWLQAPLQDQEPEPEPEPEVSGEEERRLDGIHILAQHEHYRQYASIRLPADCLFPQEWFHMM